MISPRSATTSECVVGNVQLVRIAGRLWQFLATENRLEQSELNNTPRQYSVQRACDGLVFVLAVVGT